MTQNTKTTITGASFATVLSLAMAHTAAADPQISSPTYVWGGQPANVAYVPAPTPDVLVPTADAASMTCNRPLIASNPPLAGQILGNAHGDMANKPVGRGAQNLSATAGGVLIGVLANEPYVDRVIPADAACAQYALENTRNGQTVSWISPEYGQHFAFTAYDSSAVGGNEYCRDYTGQSYVDGRTTTMAGTVCRRPNGQWKVMN
jgi:surface antigen